VPYKLGSGAAIIQSGRARWGLGCLWLLLVMGEDTGGRYTLIEQLMPHGSQAEPHRHEREDESFYVLEGELVFSLGEGEDERVVCGGAGAFVWIPRGTRHALHVESEAARALNTCWPAGREQSILAQTVPARELSLPPRDL
jgi:quercetin dioxygenase-like cupin family protein